jgi:hypothetical protein
MPGWIGTRDHDRVSDLLWNDVAEWFAPDGSLLDAYIFQTTVDDWQKLIDLVRSRGWWYQYVQDGRPSRLPDRASQVFHARMNAVATTLHIRPVATLLVNTWRFQAVDASSASSRIAFNFSDGFNQPSVCRGLPFNSNATASR